MDPLSVTLSVVTLVKTCKSLLVGIRAVIERMKKSRKVLLDLLNELNRVCLLLQSVRELATKLKNRKRFDILFDLHVDEFEKTLPELEAFIGILAERGRTLQLWRAITWSQYEGKANVLLAQLKTIEDHVNSVLIVTAAKSTVNVETQMNELLQRMSDDYTIVDSFNSLKLVDDQEQPLKIDLPKSDKVTVWHGYTLTETLPEEYITARYRLSEAAYWGDWTVLRAQLDTAEMEYGENWINCSRLSSDVLDHGNQWVADASQSQFRSQVL
ncbi:MAG: hypothetical protein M1820_000142 [Bogoriella megaspora]|nr:MAG: hypothetical protein M1820_000142 [Bogoriella megaspora]